jgi:hypothetical protein
VGSGSCCTLTLLDLCQIIKFIIYVVRMQCGLKARYVYATV